MTTPLDNTEYPIKVLGVNSPTFIDEITQLVSKEMRILSTKNSESFKGRFISVTFIVDSPSEESIKTLFEHLRQLPSVKLVL